MNDHEIARDVAQSAGDVLLAVRGSMAADDLRAVRDAGDAEAHRHIVHRLRQARPDDAVLSEEGADDAGRLQATRVWIVDPLDGTREYAEGRSDWAVHVALWERGALAAGAVALPGEDLVLSTAEAVAVPPAAAGPVRLVVSRTRPPQVATVVQRRLEGELVPMGSAGAKTMAVVRGHADVYVHAGGQYEWDSAAPVAVARHAGLHTSRVDGTPLHYNQADPYLPDLLVCRPELADRVLGALRDAA